MMKHIPDARLIPLDHLEFRPFTKAGDLSRLIGDGDLAAQTIEVSIFHSSVTKRINWEGRERYKTEAWISQTNIHDTPKAIFLCDSFTNGF